MGKLLGNIEGPKGRVEPRPAPAVKCGVGVLVPFGEFRAQAGGLVGGSHAGDFRNAEFLCEKMRRQQDEAADSVIRDAPRIDRGDRGTVAMPDEDAATSAR